MKRSRPLSIIVALLLFEMGLISRLKAEGNGSFKGRTPIRFFQARRLEDSLNVPEGFRVVEIERGSKKLKYFVCDTPFLTEKHVSHVKEMKVPDMISVVLDSIGRELLKRFSLDSTNIHQPMGIWIGKRWISFPYLLAPIPGGVITVKGLKESEKDLLLKEYGGQKSQQK